MPPSRKSSPAIAPWASLTERLVPRTYDVRSGRNSTYADEFARAYPDRYFEMFIAEQQMVAAAVGLSVRHYVPFASTFAAFLTRAHDFIRMAAISQANLRLVGSHTGVEIGADGPSQMALEDLAMMRAVHGSTVLYPSDATSAAALVAAMADCPGISYMRTTRAAYPVLYDAADTFPVGGSRTLRSTPTGAVALVGAGVTLHGCLDAADRLAGDGISARVIDLYSVKPVDTATLVAAAEVTHGRIVVVEDHHPEGGLGFAVTDALLAERVPPLRIVHLSVPGAARVGHVGRAAARRRHRRGAHRVGRARPSHRRVETASMTRIWRANLTRQVWPGRAGLR
jgi:transketolase